MEDKLKYIVISQKQTIAYDEEKCLINQKEYSEKDRDGKPSKAFAEEKQKDFYLSLFQRHFQNVVVLTAAGTSMDNDNGDDTSHRGKTREGLWNACKKDNSKNKVSSFIICECCKIAEVLCESFEVIRFLKLKSLALSMKEGAILASP